MSEHHHEHEHDNEHEHDPHHDQKPITKNPQSMAEIMPAGLSPRVISGIWVVVVFFLLGIFSLGLVKMPAFTPTPTILATSWQNQLPLADNLPFSENDPILVTFLPANHPVTLNNTLILDTPNNTLPPQTIQFIIAQPTNAQQQAFPTLNIPTGDPVLLIFAESPPTDQLIGTNLTGHIKTTQPILATYVPFLDRLFLSDRD